MCRLGCLLLPGVPLGNLYFETVFEDGSEVLDMCMRVLHFHLQNISLFCRHLVSVPHLDVAAEEREHHHIKQNKGLEINVHASWFCTYSLTRVNLFLSTVLILCIGLASDFFLR